MNGFSDLTFPENRYFSCGYFFVHVSSLQLMATLAYYVARARLSVNNGGEAGRKLNAFGIPLGLDGLRFRIFSPTAISLIAVGAVIFPNSRSGKWRRGRDLNPGDQLRSTRFPSERTRPGYATSPK